MSPARRVEESIASRRASRSRRAAFARSSAALPTTSPTTSAIAKNTTAATMSRVSSKRSVRSGSSTIGRTIEARTAVNSPPQSPPVTAETVTASMNTATPEAGPTSVVAKASRVATRVAMSPVATARHDRRPHVFAGSITAGTLPPASRTFTPPSSSQILHAGPGIFHATFTRTWRPSPLERGSRRFTRKVVTPDAAGLREGTNEPLSSEPVREAGDSLQSPASGHIWGRSRTPHDAR